MPEVEGTLKKDLKASEAEVDDIISRALEGKPIPYRAHLSFKVPQYTNYIVEEKNR